MEQTPTITVAEALRLPDLQRGLPEIVAGAESVDRPIRWVHASEAANIATLLSGRELLLTTGMALEHGVESRRRYIDGLVRRELAALVIELGSVLKTIPADVRAAAEQAGLPLIALHREVAFVKVTEAIHTELISRRYNLLRRGEEIQRQLVEVMLSGDGISEVLRTFSEIVGNPVFLQGADGRLLFHAGTSDDLDAWERLADETDGVSLEQPVPMGRMQNPGRLVILATSRALSELDMISLNHAASIVSLALLRAREEDELVVRERGNLLADLADGVITGSQGCRQAHQLGFPDSSHSLLAFAFSEAPERPAASRAALLADLGRALPACGFAALVGGRTRHETLFALVSLSAPRERETAATSVAEVIRRTWETRHPGTRVEIAVDGPVTWEQAGGALATAAETLGCAAVLPDASWHDAGRLELERLLWSLQDHDRLGAFVQRNLGALLRHDRNHKLQLIPTLEVLCANGGRKAETARALHLNRQALYYRISRIEALSGVSLSDQARLLTLHVALHARRYVSV